MNSPPTRPVARVTEDALRRFVVAVFESLELPGEDARLLADLLVANDLRGVFSHGTSRMHQYVRQFCSGELNASPSISVVSETPTTLHLDGDGGLGFFAAHRAARAVCAKAADQGIAIGVTGNHGHIGSAGTYTRMVAEDDMIGYVTSGRQITVQPGRSVRSAAGGSPMSFAVPSDGEPPFVLDFGVFSAMKRDDVWPTLLETAPGLVFQQLGLGVVCQSLGGFLAGTTPYARNVNPTFKGANQGATVVAIDPGRFLPKERFNAVMGDYIAKAMRMQPLPGCDRTQLPGGIEWEREREYRAAGIPIGEEHAHTLSEISGQVAIPLPDWNE